MRKSLLGNVPRPRKYNHIEAFCLMLYRCESCGHEETLWNSRDGVTPFIIRCVKCSGEALHVEWRRDKCVPDHKPSQGDRIFVDLTAEAALAHARAQVERCWDDPDMPMKDHPSFAGKTREEAALDLSGNRRCSEPDIITFTESG